MDSINLIKSRINNYIQTFDEFNADECFLLIGLIRKKDNPYLTCKKEVCVKEVIYNTTDINFVVDKLIAIMRLHKGKFRIYISVNKRSLTKARKKTLINLISSDNTHPAKEWKSVLSTNEVRASRRFLVDIDDINHANYLENTLLEMNIERHSSRDTLNGRHIIVEPFNTKEFKEKYADKNFEIHKDALYFIGFIDYN